MDWNKTDHPNLMPVVTCMGQEFWKCLAGLCWAGKDSHAVLGRCGAGEVEGWEGQEGGGMGSLGAVWGCRFM